MNEQKQKLIFIGGPQRAGTTLIQTMIANSLKGGIVLSEAHILYDVLNAYRKGVSEWAKTECFFENKKEFELFIKSSIQTIIESIFKIHGTSQYVVFKDPNFVMLTDHIVELFPSSTIIACVRDPRDIVCSFIRIEERESKLGLQRKNYSSRNLQFYCSKLNKSFKWIKQSIKRPYIIKYEDIVKNPKSEMEKVSKKCGLDFMTIDYTSMRWAEQDRRHKKSWISSLEENAPSPKRIGQYKSLLKNEEIEYIQKKCKSNIEHFGYKVDKISKIKGNTKDTKKISNILLNIITKIRHST